LLGGDRRIVPRLLRAVDAWVAPGAAAAASTDLAHLATKLATVSRQPIEFARIAEHPEAGVILRSVLEEVLGGVVLQGGTERLWSILATNEAGDCDILGGREEFMHLVAALMSPISIE
jgi:hypothetical protein